MIVGESHAAGSPSMRRCVRVAGAPQSTQIALQLVHRLGDRHELWHRPERLTAEVGVEAREDHATTARRQ